MKIIQGVDLITVVDQLSFACGIDVLNGSLRQSYDKSYKEYSPNRADGDSYLLLMPWIGSYDSFNGNAEYTTRLPVRSVTYILKRIVNGVWTETNLNSTTVSGYRVVTPSDDTIDNVAVTVGVGEFASSTPVYVPAWSLIIEENVPGTETREIEAHIFCLDPQTGKTVERVETKTLSTNTTETRSLKLMPGLTTPINLVLEPIHMTKTNGVRIDTITAQLYSDNAEAADANAIYWWYFWDNGTPTLITADNQLFLVEGLTDGVFSKTIKINVDRISQLVLMCRAEFWDGTGTAPTSPSDESADLKLIFNRSRRYSNHIYGNVEAPQGVKIKPDVDVTRRLQLSDKFGDLTDDEVNEHFNITWKRRTSDGTIRFAGYGIEISGKARDFGVSDSMNSSLIPEVSGRGAYAIITKNNKAITLNNKLLLIQETENI